MASYRSTCLLVCSVALLSTLAFAQAPGPTDPSGPRLDQPSSPRTGTELTDPAKDEQIRRGTLIDRQDSLQDHGLPQDTAPTDGPPTDDHRTPAQSR